MDDTDLRAAFWAHKDAARKKGVTMFTRRMVVAIADMARETPRGIVLRLERMRLLKPGSWEWFAANGGISPEQIREVRTARQALARAEDGAG